MSYPFIDPDNKVPEEGDVIEFLPREVSDVVNCTPEQTDRTHFEPGFAGKVVERYLGKESGNKGMTPHMVVKVAETDDPEFFEVDDKLTVTLTSIGSRDYIEWKRSG
jgi:hypothetical protein